MASSKVGLSPGCMTTMAAGAVKADAGRVGAGVDSGVSRATTGMGSTLGSEGELIAGSGGVGMEGIGGAVAGWAGGGGSTAAGTAASATDGLVTPGVTAAAGSTGAGVATDAMP